MSRKTFSSYEQMVEIEFPNFEDTPLPRDSALLYEEIAHQELRGMLPSEDYEREEMDMYDRYHKETLEDLEIIQKPIETPAMKKQAKHIPYTPRPLNLEQVLFAGTKDRGKELAMFKAGARKIKIMS